MKRLFLLWLLLLVAGFIVAEPLNVVVRHDVNLRFDAFLTLLLAPAVQAVLLFLFLPSLRDRRFVGPAQALAGSRVATVAGVLLIVVCAVSLLVVARALPREAFDVVRGVLALGAAAAFARAAMQRVHGALGAAVLFAILGMTSGRLSGWGERIFPMQPLAFRWLVFFAVTTVVVLVAILMIVDRLRAGAPHAAILLEWSLAPATVAGLIVLANFYERPFITATKALLANALGLAAVGFAVLAGLAAARRS